LVTVETSELGVVLVLVLEILKIDYENEEEDEEDAGFSTRRIWATRP
jgi:hypothetical protein